MADEFSFSIAFKFKKADVGEFEKAFLQMVSTIAGNVFIHNMVSVGITEEAMALGEVTAAKAFCAIYNHDPTNYMEWRDATGASNDVIYIGPKSGVIFRMGTDVTAPYLIANTAAVNAEYWVVPA